MGYTYRPNPVGPKTAGLDGDDPGLADAVGRLYDVLAAGQFPETIYLLTNGEILVDVRCRETTKLVPLLHVIGDRVGRDAYKLDRLPTARHYAAEKFGFEFPDGKPTDVWRK